MFLHNGLEEVFFSKYNHPHLRSNSHVTPQTIKLPLDHFNSSNTRTIEIRYWIDDSCYVSGGPIFFNMGGEAEAYGVTCGPRERKFGAMVVSYEHRFYGLSVPEGDLSDENMPFLSVEQNLADADAIVKFVKSSRASLTNAKVIAFGGSYSGATCAWFRIAYPGTVLGCVSSSGVVNAILNFHAFDEVIGEATARPSAACSTRLGLAYRAIDRAFDSGKGDAIKRAFNATNLIGTKMGDSDFFYAIADGPAMLVQYGTKSLLCNVLSRLSDSATDDERIANLGEAIREGYGDNFASMCFYDSECLKQTYSPMSGVGMRQWRWQKCSQLAYLQTAPTDRTPMRSAKLTLPVLLEQCEYVFGKGQIPDPDAFDNIYGGAHPHTTNVFFLDFSDDPWKRASVNETLSSALPYCMTDCDGCGHCGAGVPAAAMAKCDGEVDDALSRWMIENDLVVIQ